MSTKKMKVPKKGIQLTEDSQFVQLSEGDNDVSTFSMVAYTGEPMEHPLFGKLAVDVSGVQFSKKRFPILEEHDREKKVGVSNKKPDTSDGTISFSNLSFLNNSVAQEVKSNLEFGFPYQASISIKPAVTEELGEDQTAEVNGSKIKGPAVILRKSEFKEASVCVFGVDNKTSVASFSEDELEEIEVDLVNPGDDSMEFANNPNYDGTETSDWSSVPKDMKSVIGSYYKFHPDAERDEDGPIERVDQMPAAMKKWIASLTLNGKSNTDEWEVLFSYPVVNHRTRQLNKNGVEAAMTYAKQHGPQDVYDKARKLWDKHWGEKKQNYDGGKTMDLNELKQNYPELHEQIQTQFSEMKQKIEDKDKEITSLKSEKENMENSIQQYENRIAKLEKAEQMRLEQDVKNSADSIIQQHLKESSIPERLHDKVIRQINHNDFVEQTDNGPALQVENFTEQVKAEVKDWADALGEVGSSNSTILGASSADDNNRDDDKYFSDLSDHMVSLAVGEQKTEQ